MKQLTKSKSIKFSETQFNSLEILESSIKAKLSTGLKK